MTSDDQDGIRGFCRAADVGSTLAYMGSLVSFLVNSEESGGGLTFLVDEARKGNEPPPHVHAWEHEIFYMLEGERDFYVEGVDDVLRVRPGELVFMPRGKAHAFITVTPTMKAVAVLCAVNGHRSEIGSYFRQMAVGPAESMHLPAIADRYATIGAEAMRAAANLAMKHGITFLSDDEIAGRLPSFVAARSSGQS